MSLKNKDNLFFFSWVVSIIATFGSLYFSEIRQFIPCELCWWQRIFMYPMAFLLGVAYVRKEWQMSLYACILSGIGGLISTYHYALQKLPMLQNVHFCEGTSCSGAYINWLGFITIPFMALVAFILIFITSLIVFRQSKGDK